MTDFEQLPPEPKLRRNDRDPEKIHDVYKRRRMPEIDINDAIAQMGGKVTKIGDQFVIVENGREWRNPKRRKVIRDYFTCNGYRVTNDG